MAWDAGSTGDVYLMSCLAENRSPAAGNSDAHWETGAAVPPLWRSCCKAAPDWRKLHWAEKTPATPGRTGCCQLLPEEFRHGQEEGESLPRVTRLSIKGHNLFYFINSLNMTKAAEAIYVFLFCVYVCVSILLCSPGCTQTCNIPISAPQVLGPQCIPHLAYTFFGNEKEGNLPQSLTAFDFLKKPLIFSYLSYVLCIYLISIVMVLANMNLIFNIIFGQGLVWQFNIAQARPKLSV